MNQREEILSTLNVKKALSKLAIPSIAAMLINMIYSMTDTFFIGQLNDTTAMAAVMVVMPILLILGAVGGVFGAGGSVLMSIALGKKDADEVSNTFVITLISSLLIALLSSVLCTVFTKSLLVSFGASSNVIELATSYARIIFMGNIFTILNAVFNALVRAEGATGAATIGMVLGAVTNIILDPIFIFTFGMGISGAAIATTIGAVVSALYYSMFYLKHKSVITVEKKHFTFEGPKLGRIIALGLPSSLTSILMSISFALFNILGAQYGDAFIAATGLSTRIISMVIMVIIGLANGFQPLAGYCYGAKLYGRLKDAIRYTFIAATAFTSVSYVFLRFFDQEVIGLFTDIPEVLQACTLILKVLTTFLPLLGTVIIAIVLFVSLGKAKEAMILALTRQGFVLLPAMFILPHFLGKDGLIYAQALADFVSIIVCGVLLVGFKNEFQILVREKESLA